MSTGNLKLDQRVEALCKEGCKAVHGYIKALRNGIDLPQFTGLNNAERLRLRAELEAIMAVYGDVCRA